LSLRRKLMTEMSNWINKIWNLYKHDSNNKAFFEPNHLLDNSDLL